MLLSTKFHCPLSVGRLTQRPRLDVRLDEGLQTGCPLTLIIAPAGFGKSTLASAWLRKQEVPSAWLSLDGSDNDPGQFLSYLVGALQNINPTIGISQVNRIQTAEASDSEAVYADVMMNLVNEISLQPSPFLLVLDDCHILKNQTVLQLVIFLVEHQPAPLRLMLLSREDLPLPVSRLRARRQITEIRQSDLQFSLEEADDFLRVGMGISQLSHNDIQALEQRTEGWIAGLQLAGLSIKSDPDPAHFIQSFTGSDKYILDYFMDEVFTRQPEEVQTFLLASSILDRFCAPLCAEVQRELTGDSDLSAADSQMLLERLERSDLFLIPLDHLRKWYRYHHLFADLLRHALVRAAPSKIPSLHLRASQWLEANGFISEAVQHSFKTQDWIYAAELVERHAWNTILHSQISLVSEWCRTFPEAIISKRPSLCVFHGWALIIAFKREDFPAAIVRIEQAQAVLADIDPDAEIILVVGAQPVNLLAWVTGQLTLLRSFILMSESRKLANPQALVDLGQLSYTQLPPEDVTGLSVSLLDISYASQAQSDVEDAEKKFEQVVRVALSGGNYFGAVVAEYHRAHGLFVQGRLREVVEFCRQKRKDYESFFENPILEMPALALFDQAEGCAWLELNELEQAERLLRAGLEVGQWMPREELPGYLALARLCAMKGDHDGMEESWRRLDMRWPDIKYCTRAMRVLFDLESNPGDLETRETASAWSESNSPEIGPGIMIPGIGPAFFDEADHAVYVAWIKIQLILGNAKEALSVIRPMLDVAQKFKLVHRIIELSMLEARSFFIQGKKESAWRSLRLAVGLAESNSYLRIVDDHDPILVKMLKEATRNGISPTYIQHILEINGSIPNLSVNQTIVSINTADNELIEPLSNREQEVLVLMAEGLSNSEIASKLYLSPNTLKAHTQNIFRKLEVHNRVQAVNKARELRLI
jgi:LuxR family transcriptional regulator, maltose regulon positive regulatory protein